MRQAGVEKDRGTGRRCAIRHTDRVGDQDHGTPPEMARLIHQNLRGSQFIVIPDAAHISNIEQPEFFNRELLKFLAQQQA